MTQVLGRSVLKMERNRTFDIKNYWDIVFSGIGTLCSGRMTQVLGRSVLKMGRNRTFDIKKYWNTVFSGIGTFCSGRKKEREVSCQRAFCQLDCTISGTIFLPPHSLKMQKMAIP